MVNRRAIAAETSTLRPSANRAMAARTPETLARAVARNVYGLARATSIAYGVKTASPAGNGLSTKTVRSCVCPATGLAVSGNVSGSPSAGWKAGLPSPCVTHQPNVIVTSAWPSLLAMIRRWSGSSSLATTRGSTVPSASTTGPFPTASTARDWT